MFIAILAAAALASPVSECAERLKKLGADDAKRAVAVCECTGGAKDVPNDIKGTCFQKVYKWSYDDTGALIGMCAEATNVQSQEGLDACVCVAWGMIEKMPAEDWILAPSTYVQKFVENRMAVCKERVRRGPPTTEAAWR